MSKEAMSLALEALEKMARWTGPLWALENNYAGHLEAITALREDLAQPSPEISIADAFRAGVDSGIAAERDACEMAIEELPPDADRGDCAAAIRARGNT